MIEKSGGAVVGGAELAVSANADCAFSGSASTGVGAIVDGALGQGSVVTDHAAVNQVEPGGRQTQTLPA